MRWVAAAVAATGGAVAAVILAPLALMVVLIFSLVHGVGSASGGPSNLGPPVNLGAVHPPSAVVTLDKTVAAAPRSEVSCSVPASLLLAQQFVESGYNPSAASGAGAIGLSQFLPSTFTGYDHPVPPGGAAPPSATNPTDAAYAEARYLCSLGIDTNAHNALVAYNCGNPGATCQAASSGYANTILSLATRISAAPAPAKTGSSHG